MKPPTVYLIKRGLTEERIQKIREALSLTPLEAVIITTPYDYQYAQNFCEVVSPLSRPIAIIGDFYDECTALGEKNHTLEIS